MGIAIRDRKVLWARAHNQCAYPACLQELIETPEIGNGSTVLGEEAHIRAQSPGGARYDPEYAEVDSYENLLLLCPTHHTLIDKDGGSRFTVAWLLEIKSDHERQQKRHSELQTAIRAYLGDRYHAEDIIQFQQVDIHGPSVDSMFVDVPIGGRRDGTAVTEFLAQIADADPGDTAELEMPSDFVVAGATQALLHPDWVGNAVLVGGPGQGKSTVLQYVCQFHRARRLGEDAYTAGDLDLVRAATPARFPVRVDLRKYAQWAEANPSKPNKGKRSRRKSRDSHWDGVNDGWRSLEEYVVEDIGRHIGANKFEARDLAVLLATEPVLLALDGLDEVASLPLRERVTKEIAGVQARLSPIAANLVILVATRPGSSLRPLTGTKSFPVLLLQRLTQGLRLQYLQRWVAVSKLSKESSERLQAAFMDNQSLPHINELASYPMQLAILLHLLHRRQLLPQQRTELYREYLKTFLDREQTEDKEPLLGNQRRVVENTHAFLAWYIQTKAEQGESSGAIGRDQLRTLLREFLAGRNEELKLAETLYSAITSRVLCLVERDDAFEFEVQSLREYFAAWYIFQNLPPKGNGNSRDDGLDALLERPYWANVCRFFIGMLSDGEVRALRDNFRVVDKRVSPLPIIRSMAATILNDRTYEGHTDSTIRDAVNMVLDGPGVLLAEDGLFDGGGAPLRLGERAGRSQAVAHLKERLEGNESSVRRDAIASCLRGHAIPEDDLASWWWSQFDLSPDWFESASILGIFNALGGVQVSHLRSLISKVDQDSEWYTDLLARGRYDGGDLEILEAARRELNDGAAGSTRSDLGKTDLTILIECAEIAAAGTILRAPQAEDMLSRGRAARLNSDSFSSRILRATLTFPDNFDSSSPVDWQERLLVLAEVWGGGYVLRRAVSAIPESIDNAAIESMGRNTNRDLSEAVATEVAYRANRGNSEWWRTHLESSKGPCDRMIAILALFERSHAKVFIELSDIIDKMVGTLAPKRYRIVEHTLRRDALARRVRPLALQEALRTKQIDLSGRALWLVRIVGSDATKKRVGPELETKLGDLLRSGVTDGREAVAAAYTKRKLKLAALKHARQALPPGSWASDAILASMTLPLAKEILFEPENWPIDIVQIASERMLAERTRRLKTLDEVSSTYRWFDEEK